MKYKHLFFDLDHTIWDFEANSRTTLVELYEEMKLKERGVDDFDLFHKNYLAHNERLWERYRKGFVKQEELRVKRMWLSLLDFKIADEPLAKKMGDRFLEMLPTRTILFPYTIEILDYLTDKSYELHLITNGFEHTQHSKLKHSGLSSYFKQVITSEGSNSLKPKKEIFDFAFQKTGATPDESIMIGDTMEVDILGAINAGIDQIHVNHLTNEPLSINGKLPTHTIYSLKELERIF
ncbi:MAG: noncanonical pyrimidine nucleotidase, YjjG family [Chitinophagaceae bacterium]|nr:noncanonical pyrimidine nucleotidase, YjjG family [Chitinophagaceae bacterium]MBK8606578.1 noncanonical pyrimidine nucleotidase, YjjG family [Chitinophagaceae bacterium]MBP6476122.1 YjjG family noncanonical pyrimidine nucleotidase [Chitinophagaceae bacterium]MBP7107245.1 YjjG family noncanonical pyrimidine nucleotidase [Chitinophagaceae bacterium]MBP7315615.1 YjjG family noncanonical pyrimidine nucleotidase [Chitinophagaceae bacterium]